VTRMVLCLTEAEWTLHGKDLQALTSGPIGAAKLYSQWADGSWVIGVNHMHQCLVNPDCLSGCLIKMGHLGPPSECEARTVHKVHFHQSHTAVTHAKVIGHQVAWEEHKAKLMFNITICLMRHRSWGMLWHSECVPGLIAGLALPGPAQKRCAAKLQEFHEAHQAALLQPLPEPRKWARESPMQASQTDTSTNKKAFT
jgi:hypothetical protein